MYNGSILRAAPALYYSCFILLSILAKYSKYQISLVYDMKTSYS